MTNGNPQAREVMLARIRRALEAGGEDVSRRVAVQRRLANPKANTVPARAQGPRPDQLAAFVARLQAQAATVARAGTASDVPGLVADYLRSQNLPARVRTGDDPRLAGLDWSSAPGLTLDRGRASGEDAVGLSHAFAGAAETGTLVLASGASNPTTVNFLPETHIVVVAGTDVAGSYEDVWRRLRGEHGDRTLPRTVNFISGPSRTADIEGTLVMGAHGPRRLHVIVVGDG